MADKTRPTKIIFVCLGNICRSPMAEFLAKDLLQKRFPQLNVVCDSAGTDGCNDGAGAHPGTANELAKHGISCSGFVSKRLTRELVEAND